MKDHRLDLRADTELVERVDALANRLSQLGVEVTRSAAARVALRAGLAALEKAAGQATAPVEGA